MTEPGCLARLQAKRESVKIPIPGWEFVGWVYDGYLQANPLLSDDAIPVYRQVESP